MMVGDLLPAWTDYATLRIADLRNKTPLSPEVQEKRQLLSTGGLKRKLWIPRDLEQLCKCSKCLTARAFKYLDINVIQVRLI